eukprot:3625706-Pleurochrysis_carterae.AAC.1
MSRASRREPSRCYRVRVCLPQTWHDGAAMARATSITGTLGPSEFVQIRGVCTELKELRWQR